MQVSSRAAGVVGSVTLEIDAKAKKMKADGIDVVGFGAGEPDFPTPQFVIDAAKDPLHPRRRAAGAAPGHLR